MMDKKEKSEKWLQVSLVAVILLAAFFVGYGLNSQFTGKATAYIKSSESGHTAKLFKCSDSKCTTSNLVSSGSVPFTKSSLVSGTYKLVYFKSDGTILKGSAPFEIGLKDIGANYDGQGIIIVQG